MRNKEKLEEREEDRSEWEMKMKRVYERERELRRDGCGEYLKTDERVISGGRTTNQEDKEEGVRRRGKIDKQLFVCLVCP